MLKQFTPEQVRDVCLRRYGFYENGKFKEPPLELIEEHDRLSVMSLHDWYESVLCDILKFPHRIEFDLERFGLADWKSRIESCRDIVYNPVSAERHRTAQLADLPTTGTGEHRKTAVR
jgi:hypothetical protein